MVVLLRPLCCFFLNSSPHGRIFLVRPLHLDFGRGGVQSGVVHDALHEMAS